MRHDFGMRIQKALELLSVFVIDHLHIVIAEVTVFHQTFFLENPTAYLSEIRETFLHYTDALGKL